MTKISNQPFFSENKHNNSQKTSSKRKTVRGTIFSNCFSFIKGKKEKYKIIEEKIQNMTDQNREDFEYRGKKYLLLKDKDGKVFVVKKTSSKDSIPGAQKKCTKIKDYVLKDGKLTSGNDYVLLEKKEYYGLKFDLYDQIISNPEDSRGIMPPGTVFDDSLAVQQRGILLREAVGNASPKERMKYAIDLLHGANTFCKSDYFHNDIKPANIVVANGEAKFIDYQSAKIINIFGPDLNDLKGILVKKDSYSSFEDIYQCLELPMLAALLIHTLIGFEGFHESNNLDDFIKNTEKIKNENIRNIIRDMLGTPGSLSKDGRPHPPKNRKSIDEIIEIFQQELNKMQ